MSKSDLELNQEKDGLWSYSYFPEEGVSVEGQVRVTPGQYDGEKSAALKKIKRAIGELADHLNK